MLKYFILFSTLTMLFSCGKSTDEATAEAILTANICLSKSDCRCAIDVLEANGRVNNNAPYLKTLASAYACKAGYSTLTFFTSDLAKTVAPAPLGGTTLYTTSSASVTTTLQNDQKFKDLQTAIDILLYAGGIDSTNTEPTSAERAKYFTTSEAADIDSQLLYMVMVQTGRYMYYYGNGINTGVDAGKKGKNTGPNNCFTTYAVAAGDAEGVVITNALEALNGTCKTSNAVTHPELSADTGIVAAATRKKRLCHGVVLLNNVFSLLPNVIASAFPVANQQAALDAVSVIRLAQTALTTADPTASTVASTMNQTICEDTTLVSVVNIEEYFAAMFEGAFL